MSLDSEYQKAHRRVKSGLIGICHLKLVVVQHGPQETFWVTAGSANFTPSSRCNAEVSLGLDVVDADPVLKELLRHFDYLWDRAILFTELARARGMIKQP